jgi:hypothetical protein
MSTRSYQGGLVDRLSAPGCQRLRENVGCAGVGRASPAWPSRFRRHLRERWLPVDLIFHTETFAFDDDSLGVMQ